MEGANGHGNGSDGPLMERLVGLTMRLNGSLDIIKEKLSDIDEALGECSERLALLLRSSEQAEREQRRQAEILWEIRSALGEARKGIGRVEDQTDPHLRVTDPAQDQPREDGGAIVAIARLAEKVPASWWPAALKGAMALGGGALLHWLAQTFLTKH